MEQRGAPQERTPASGRVIVQLDLQAPAAPAALEERAAALAATVPGGRVVRVSRRGRAVLRLPEGTDLTAAAAALAADPAVVYAEPDSPDHAV